MWYVKALAGKGVYLFLPITGGDGSQILRPNWDIPSYSEVKTWTVVYSKGVSVRKSNEYDDKQEPKGHVLTCGETFQGRAIKHYGSKAGPEMIHIEADADGNPVEHCWFVPMTTRRGKSVCVAKPIAPTPAPSIPRGPVKVDPPPPPPPAPEASPWTMHEHEGRNYWHNDTTGETTWTPPGSEPPPPPPPPPGAEEGRVSSSSSSSSDSEEENHLQS